LIGKGTLSFGSIYVSSDPVVVPLFAEAFPLRVGERAAACIQPDASFVVRRQRRTLTRQDNSINCESLNGFGFGNLAAD
jgi:hypothetical protein